MHMARALAFVLSERLCPPKPINSLCQSTENCQKHMRGPIQIHHPGLASPPAAAPQGGLLGFSEKAFTSDSRERQSQKCTALQKKQNQTHTHTPTHPHAHVNLEMNIISPLLIANTGHRLNETVCTCYLIRPCFFQMEEKQFTGIQVFPLGQFPVFQSGILLSVIKQLVAVFSL